MSNKIDSHVGPAAPAAPLRPVSRSRDQASSVAAEPTRRDAVVALTGEAQALQKLEQAVQQDSGIDEAKVAETRRLLAQGLYSPDPQAIAGRLMQLEWSLSNLK